GRAHGEALPATGKEVGLRAPAGGSSSPVGALGARGHRMRAIEEQDVVIAQLIEPSTAATLHWILRVAVAGCFIGHGAFGIITKAAWVPYFAIFGIPEAWAWK